MIKFTSVKKQFPPDTNAVDDVSFEIAPGELVLLTGPSGSGKTTIMKLLTREYLATEGEILFSNENLSKIKNSNVHKHRRRIGVVFQDYKLLPRLNIWENIALPLSIIGKSQEEMEQRVTDLLNLVELADKAFLFPQQLSGGEAQRIGIARALSTGPSIIFADEPTGNLDREASIKIGKLIKKINSFGTTIIFATHDHDIMDLFEEARLIHLDKGKIVKDTKKVEQEIKTDEDKPTKKINLEDAEVKNDDQTEDQAKDQAKKDEDGEKKTKKKNSKSRRKTKKIKVKAKNK